MEENEIDDQNTQLNQQKEIAPTNSPNRDRHKPLVGNWYMFPIALTLTLILGLILGEKIAKPNTEMSSSSNGRYNKLQNIMDQLDRNYVDQVNKDSLFESTISSMLHQLDPHSNYIPAEELLAMQESIEGKFGGVGVRFTIIRDTVCVTHVLPNSPSAEVGVLPGDLFLKVDGKPFFGKSVNNEKVMKSLKGIEITRGSIPIKSISVAYMIAPGIGFIKLDEFSMTSDEEFVEATTKLKAQGMKKLIFDLRDNGGGVLETAVNIVDEMLANNMKIVSTRGRTQNPVMYKATGRGGIENMKIVLLINQNSASASEIVAGALQDNDRAIVAGRRSFGKGLVQQDISLADQSNLRLTVARYYTPTGRCIQKPYNGKYEDYIMEENARFESGELYKIDSSLMVDSLKFKTPKGKIVYGGGGIMPDVFIPLDTTSSTLYLMRLRVSGVFQDFAFDFLRNKRKSFSSIQSYMSNFKIDQNLMDQFMAYSKKETKVVFDAKQFALSKSKIELLLKAEIARQIWQENGYFEVLNKYDKEVIKAISL
jgi:carboxyl-terminal processing protease